MSYSHIEPLGDLVEMDFAEPRSSSDDFQVFDMIADGTCCANPMVSTTNDGHRTQQCWSCGHYYLKDGKIPDDGHKNNLPNFEYLRSVVKIPKFTGQMMVTEPSDVRVVV